MTSVFTHLKGKKPLFAEELFLIEDEYVDIEFGTGCLAPAQI
jgi:valyl-tRNA synthetase